MLSRTLARRSLGLEVSAIERWCRPMASCMSTTAASEANNVGFIGLGALLLCQPHLTAALVRGQVI
jgi:hypothetical protein